MAAPAARSGWDRKEAEQRRKAALGGCSWRDERHRGSSVGFPSLSTGMPAPPVTLPVLTHIYSAIGAF